MAEPNEPKWNKQDLKRWTATVQTVQRGIARAATSLAEHTWDMGDMLRGIEDAGLWARVPGDDGAPRYTNFAAVIEDLTPFRRAYGYQLASLARTITRDQAVELGTTRALRLAAAPEEVRTRLLPEAIRQNLPEREIAERVRAARGGDERRRAPQAPHVSALIGHDWTVPVTAGGIGSLGIAEGLAAVYVRMVPGHVVVSIRPMARVEE